MLKPFKGPGSTPSRRRFWAQLADAVNASRKIAGRHVSVDVHPGKGTLVNVDDTSARRGGGSGPPTVCPSGDEIMVSFSGIVSCGCLTDGTLSYWGIDNGLVNSAFTLTRFSSTEFSFFPAGLTTYKRWSNTDCSGDPDINRNTDCIVYARCIEASGLWTVSIQDTVTFFFAFFGNQFSTTLTNETSCSPFLSTDLFHNGTATVSF